VSTEKPELSPLEAFQKYGALGPDFLTWVLIRTLGEGVPAPTSEPALSVNIHGPLVFTGEDGEAKKVTMAGEEAASAPEVNSALRQGKRLTRAKLIFTAQEDTWTFTLDAEFFDLKSIKLPVPAMPDLETYLELRLQSTARLYFLVDELFDLFLKERLDPEGWPAEVKSWKKPIKTTNKD
jgi:hypothetical protein